MCLFVLYVMLMLLKLTGKYCVPYNVHIDPPDCTTLLGTKWVKTGLHYMCELQSLVVLALWAGCKHGCRQFLTLLQQTSAGRETPALTVAHGGKRTHRRVQNWQNKRSLFVYFTLSAGVLSLVYEFWRIFCRLVTHWKWSNSSVTF